MLNKKKKKKVKVNWISALRIKTSSCNHAEYLVDEF